MVFFSGRINTYMRYNEILTEATRGMFIRSQERAMFTNTEGRTITAIGNVIFPEDALFYDNDTIDNLPLEAKELPPAEQKKLLKTGQQKVMEVLNIYRRQTRIPLANWHVINTVGRAAMITLWKNDRNETVAFVKLFNAKSMGAIPFFWSNADFARETGYSIRNASQQKSDLNLKPSTVVGTDANLTIDEAIEQIETNIATHDELAPDIRFQVVNLIKNVESGFVSPVANASIYSNSYEVDLGETAAPIALLTGHFVSGAYQQVEEQLLKPMGSSWRKIKRISYPMNDSEVLVDSFLILNKGTKIGVSSKDKKGGAAASITSLTSEIETNPERYVDLQEQKKYKYLFNILNLLKDKSAEDGPLELGIIYKVITKEERAEIKKAIADPNMDKKQLSQNLKTLLKNPIYQPIKTNQNYTIGYHLLTTVAHIVSEQYLNKNTKIVSQFFKDIMSRSNMIQVKTSMKKVGDDAYFSNFSVIWPPTFTGTVRFYSRKNYSASSRPTGKMSFKIT